MKVIHFLFDIYFLVKHLNMQQYDIEFFEISQKIMVLVVIAIILEQRQVFMSPAINRTPQRNINEGLNLNNTMKTPAKLIDDSPFRKYCIDNLSPLENSKFMSPKFPRMIGQDFSINQF